MRFSHLVTKRSSSSIHYHFRSKIPTDLVSYFGGRKQFQISLHDVTNREIFLVSQTLNNVVKEIYSDIPHGFHLYRSDESLHKETNYLSTICQDR